MQKRIADVETFLAGNPSLLLARQSGAFIWEGDTLRALPTALSRIAASMSEQGEYLSLRSLQGRFPDAAYAELGRARRGEASGWRRELLRWSGTDWRLVQTPFTSSRTNIRVLLTNDGVLAAGCRRGRCSFYRLSGRGPLPRLAARGACPTRVEEVIDVARSPSGVVYLLGVECETGRVLVESWTSPGEKSRVELLDGVTPRPLGHEPYDVGLAMVEEEPWVFGVEWFWGGGPVFQTLLAPRRGGAWPALPTPCDSSVASFWAYGGREWLTCAGIQSWFREGTGSFEPVGLTLGTPQEVRGRLYAVGDSALWELHGQDSAGSNTIGERDSGELQLPCGGYAVNLPVDSFARARRALRAVQFERREVLLAKTYESKAVAVIAPSLETRDAIVRAIAAGSTEAGCVDFSKFSYLESLGP